MPITSSYIAAVSYDLLLAIACQRRVEHFHSLEHFIEQKCENTTMNKSHLKNCQF